MALASVAASIRKPIHGTPCSIGRLLTTLDPDDVKYLADVLADDLWSSAMIFDLLAADGHEVGRQTVGRHRRQQCRCFA